MPITVHGITDASGALAGVSRSSKTVCIIAQKTAGGTAIANKVVPILSMTDAEDKFGDTSKVPSLLKVFYNNGVTDVMAVAVSDVVAPATLASVYDTALTELLKYPGIKIIISDQVDMTIHQKIKTHLDVAETQDILRYGIVGVAGDSSALSTAAGTLNHRRMFIPDIPADDTGSAVSPILGAAGLASLIATETGDPALPMNGVTMAGFGGVATVKLKSEMDALVNAGVTPLYTEGGAPAVYRLVTTYTKDGNGETDITWQEGTTLFISDDVLSSCRDRIRSKYQRTKGVARILDSMKTDIIDVLTNKAGLEIIENLNTKLVSVIKDPNDMYGALIDYEYDVVTPLYTVTIRQHMRL